MCKPFLKPISGAPELSFGLGLNKFSGPNFPKPGSGGPGFTPPRPLPVRLPFRWGKKYRRLNVDDASPIRARISGKFRFPGKRSGKKIGKHSGKSPGKSPGKASGKHSWKNSETHFGKRAGKPSGFRDPGFTPPPFQYGCRFAGALGIADDSTSTMSSPIQVGTSRRNNASVPKIGLSGRILIGKASKSALRPILRLSGLESGRKPHRKPDFRPGGTIA